MKLLAAFLIVFATVLAGCSSYPVSEVSQGGERPALVVKGGSSDTILMLDGLNMGATSKYDGKPNKLLIERGPHTVVILRGDEVLLEQQILVTQGETKTISIAN